MNTLTAREGLVRMYRMALILGSVVCILLMLAQMWVELELITSLLFVAGVYTLVRQARLLTDQDRNEPMRDGRPPGNGSL